MITSPKPPVLVVPNQILRDALPNGSGNVIIEGVQSGLHLDLLLSHIHRHAVFMPRIQAEEDPNWRQLIPYCYLTMGEEVLTYQRKGDHTEQRLANKASVGFGGHIEAQDVMIPNSDMAPPLLDMISHCLYRELAEEALLPSGYGVSFRGCIVDRGTEASMVNLVHAGLVFQIVLVQETTDHIGMGDESKEIKWMTFDTLRWECSQSTREQEARGIHWEGWTRMAVNEGLIA